MKTISTALCALGIILILASFAFDTAPEGTYNIGLIQRQTLVFGTGSLLALIGSIVASVNAVLTRLEIAGIIPPAGVSVVTQSDLSRGDR